MEATAESFAAKMRELATGYNADFRLTAAAVSGGADSLALAFLLKDFQKQNGGRAAVLTVNHHLRPEADAEAAMVAALMKKWGIEHHVLNWFPEEGNGGIEEKAREARYRLMEDWCVKNGFYYLLTAHHQQDQAETFLMRLQRGSGVDGLSAMAEMTPRGKICVVRPLLEAEPAALRRLLRENGIAWAEDASNGCDDFLRVRIRKFLPELEKKTGISIRRLAETARALRMTREYLEAETDAFVRVRVRRFEGPAFSISPSAFARLHPEIGRRVLARLIREAGGRGYPPEYRELRRLAERLQNPLFAGCTLGGCEILPFMKRWWVIPEAGAKRVSGGRKADLPALSGGRTAVLPHKLKRLLTAVEDDC